MQAPEDYALPTIQGPNIQLRAITDADSIAIYALFSDQEVARFLTAPPLQDLAAASVLIAELDELRRLGLAFHWGVVDRASGRLIGTCTLHNVRASHQRAEVGFVLMRQHWGCGLGRELLTTLCRYAFDEVGLQRLEADVDPDNHRCIRLLQRHGFEREGRARGRWCQGGVRRDALFFGLLRQDFVPAAAGSTSL